MLAAFWFVFFFPQRGEVNVFASIQAAINAYSHRSLYEIDLSPLHAARMGSCCTHSCYQKLIQCVHPPQRLQPSLSRATLLYFVIPFTVAVLLLPPLGRFTEQLWHKSLPGTWVAWATVCISYLNPDSCCSGKPQGRQLCFAFQSILLYCRITC